MRFCDKLPKLRKENNLSQEQLADRLGVSRQAVSKWESGSSYPDMDKMIQICNILNCTLEELLDDGVIKENSKTNDTTVKNNFNTYFQDFLKFITKSYNMFCSMTFKEKMTFLAEMIILCFVLIIMGNIVASILNRIVYGLLKFLPDGIHYFLANIIETIYLTILLVLGIIIAIHIFKIRYLDYFVTIEDSNAKEKTIEEPIEKKENKKYVEKAKEKIIIRDPKHSTFSFMNLLGKLIMLFIKFFAILFLIPVIIFFIFTVFSSIILLCHVIYGTIFFYLFIVGVGVIGLTYLIIELFYKFIFNMKTNLKKIFIILIMGLCFIGIGSGLTFVRLLKYNYIEDSSNLKTITKEEHIEVVDGMQLQLNYDNTDYIIDNSLTDIKLEITIPENFYYKLQKYEDAIYDDNGSYEKTIPYYYLYFGTENMFKVYQLVMNDLKNNNIRELNSSELLKVKVYLSEQNYKMLMES